MENNQNQPPSRPWFRLASQVRMEPPPQPLPQLRPPVRPTPTFVPALRPQPQAEPEVSQSKLPVPSTVVPNVDRPTTSSSVPPSPKLNTVAPTSSLPTSPAPKAMSSSLPASPIRRTQEPAPSTVAPPARAVETPTKTFLSAPSTVAPPARAVETPAKTFLSTFTTRKAEEPNPSNVSPSTKNVETSTKKLSSSLTASPIQKGTTRVTTPPESPKTIRPSSRTPPSPMTKPSAPPPSPLSLPPAQLKPVPEPESKSFVVAEQKNVLMHEHRERHDEPPRKTEEDKPGVAQNGKGGGRGVHDKEKDKHKKLDDHEDLGMRVITIAGENRGAYMELGSSHKKQGGKSHQIHKNTARVTSEGNESGTSSGEDGKSKKKDKTMQNLPMTAFVNSNVQGVNNSILFNTSCTHSDPGVHFVFSRKPIPGQGIHRKDPVNGKHT